MLEDAIVTNCPPALQNKNLHIAVEVLCFRWLELSNYLEREASVSY